MRDRDGEKSDADLGKLFGGTHRPALSSSLPECQSEPLYHKSGGLERNPHLGATNCQTIAHQLLIFTVSIYH